MSENITYHLTSDTIFFSPEAVTYSQMFLEFLTHLDFGVKINFLSALTSSAHWEMIKDNGSWLPKTKINADKKFPKEVVAKKERKMKYESVIRSVERSLKL